jgi:cytochrome c oxidase cbb3-type subunit 3/ubiquinol-cytochrome c reductase cytochrome c subunit
MNRILTHPIALASAACLLLALTGCKAPGKPGPAEPRPDQVTDFAKLYKQNCAACHGDEGKRGLAVSLSNPVYITLAGKDAIREATANGGPGKLMPAFAKSHGGTLTDAQIEVLVDGIVQRWGHAQLLAGQNSPSYAATLTGDATAGKAAYATYCARCHAAEGTEKTHVAKTHVAGPIDDANYLALISDQGLRTAILAGRSEEGMPDWRGIAPAPLTDQQVTDIVAWLATLRNKSGQPSAPAVPATNNATQGKEISHE